VRCWNRSCGALKPMSSQPTGCTAKGKTDTGRCWVYVRDDLPFGGTAPPAAMFYYSRDRAGEHPQAHLARYTGIFQADAYGGYNKLYVERQIERAGQRLQGQPQHFSPHPHPISDMLVDRRIGNPLPC
jgi:hypothetical protein